MAEKRRPADGPAGMPPSRNLGVGNSSCGGRHEAADPLKLIVASGARKEKLQQRDFRALKLAPHPAPRTYVEMRAASAFSFLDAASLPEDLVEEAARLEIPTVALVERNGVALFVFVDDRKMRIEVGYGLEGALPDATGHRLTDGVVKAGQAPKVPFEMKK